MSVQMIPSNLSMTFLSLHLLRHGFFFCMDELGNIFNISGDIWRKNELIVKQVVCFDAVSVALTVYTGYKYVCVYIS